MATANNGTTRTGMVISCKDLVVIQELREGIFPTSNYYWEVAKDGTFSIMDDSYEDCRQKPTEGIIENIDILIHYKCTYEKRTLHKRPEFCEIYDLAYFVYNCVTHNPKKFSSYNLSKQPTIRVWLAKEDYEKNLLNLSLRLIVTSENNRLVSISGNLCDIEKDFIDNAKQKYEESQKQKSEEEGINREKFAQKLKKIEEQIEAEREKAALGGRVLSDESFEE